MPTQIPEPPLVPAPAPQTLANWTMQVTLELAGAGFWVRIADGFPTVRLPDGLEECVQQLGFQPSVPADRLITQGGVIFFPPGLMSAAQSNVRPLPHH